MNSALPCSTWFPLAETISLEPQGPHPDVSPLECPQSPVSSFGEVGEASSCLTFVISNPPGFLKSRLQTKYPKPSFLEFFGLVPLPKPRCNTVWLSAGKGVHKAARSMSGSLVGGNWLRFQRSTTSRSFVVIRSSALLGRELSANWSSVLLFLPSRPALGHIFGKCL